MGDMDKYNCVWVSCVGDMVKRCVGDMCKISVTWL